jgi:uncharacterized protein (DUF1697 family)
MAVFIALLRAVNVGGTGKLSMKELKAACEAAGLQNVSTYIASGNLVFESDCTPAEVRSVLDRVLRERFGLTKNHVLLRTPEEVAKAIAACPFGDAAKERPNRLMVTFLDSVPGKDAAANLALFEGPERLQLHGDHLYIDYPQGVAKSKLTTAYLDKTLKVIATARNWNTTNKLLAMARELEG